MNQMFPTAAAYRHTRAAVAVSWSRHSWGVMASTPRVWR